MIIKKLLKDLNIHNVIGSPHRKIDGVASLSKTETNKLMFCKPGKEHLLMGISDCVVFIAKNYSIHLDGLPIGNTYIPVDNPRLTFIRAVNMLYTKYLSRGTAPPLIHKSARIAESVHIGENCYIGQDVKIHPNVTILCETVLRENVIIYPNTSIGNTGFGQERNEHGELVKFPHLGGVHIHKNVEIGANVAIDRGTLGDTVIGEGTMIDNLVHIAHNVKIGKHCEIVCSATIAGGVKIGDYSAICAGVCIRDNLTIGNNVVIGMGAVVLKDVKDGETVIGNPGRVMNSK